MLVQNVIIDAETVTVTIEREDIKDCGHAVVGKLLEDLFAKEITVSDAISPITLVIERTKVFEALYAFQKNNVHVAPVDADRIRESMKSVQAA